MINTTCARIFLGRYLTACPLFRTLFEVGKDIADLLGWTFAASECPELGNDFEQE